MDVKIDNSASQISKLSELINRFICCELKRNGLNGIVTSHGNILYHLFSNESLQMGELAELIDKDRSTVTTLVGKLSKNGYVTLKKDSADKRAVRVSLTEKGRQIKPVMDSISRDLFSKLYKGIQDNQREAHYSAMQKMIANLSSKEQT